MASIPLCHGKYTLVVENKNERTLFDKTRKPLTHLLQYATYIVQYHLSYVVEIKIVLMIRHDSPYMVTRCATPSSIPGISFVKLGTWLRRTYIQVFLSLDHENGAIRAKICIKLRMTAL